MMINKILVKIMIMTLNHKVDGSSPSGHTNSFANFAGEKLFNFFLDIFGI